MSKSNSIPVQIVGSQINCYATMLRSSLNNHMAAVKAGNKKLQKKYKKDLDEAFLNYCNTVEGSQHA